MVARAQQMATLHESLTNPDGVTRTVVNGREVTEMAKNTGKGHRVGAVKGRSEFKRGTTWFKRDTATGRILNGSPNQHKGVRNEK